MCRVFTPGMLERQKGHIINISSTLAHATMPGINQLSYNYITYCKSIFLDYSFYLHILCIHKFAFCK